MDPTPKNIISGKTSNPAGLLQTTATPHANSNSNSHLSQT